MGGCLETKTGWITQLQLEGSGLLIWITQLQLELEFEDCW